MRSKRIVLVSHCILNQNAVLEDWDRARGAYPFVRVLIEAGIGIIQLPCPELISGGLNRPPRSKREYDTTEYKKLCRELLKPYILQLCEFGKNGYDFVGLIAIKSSPTCSMSGERGVLMDELLLLLEAEEIPLPYIEVPEDYREDGNSLDFEDKIYKFIGGK